MKPDSTPSATTTSPQPPARLRDDAPTYVRDVERLSKRRPDLPQLLKDCLEEIQKGPENGDAIPGFSHRIWKIRLRDGTKGKRGALRLIYEWSRKQNLVTPLLLFAKTEPVNESETVGFGI